MKFAVLDFETTGAGLQDEIIQIGLVIIEHDRIIDKYHSYVNPQMEIPAVITQLTGITNDMVRGAPLLSEAVAQFHSLLDDCVLVAHHVSFDLSFLQRALEKNTISPFQGRIVDTMDALRILYPGLASLQLNMVSQALDVPHERPHQADSDAEATALIWLKCLDRLSSLPLLTIQRLSHLFDSSITDVYDLGWLIHEIQIQKEMAAALDEHAGFYFRQFALQVTDWSEEQPAREDEPAAALENGSFDDFYSGLKQSLRNRFSNYEDRAAQEQMIHEVYSTFENDQHLIIEAGTGTGKSLGYLIPALYYGIRHDQKVIISTHTIQLQEQLRQRDIPLLQDIYPVSFRASVLKGRNHYLCLRKFEHKINLQDFEPVKEQRITAAQMIVWLGETMHGDDEELHFNHRGKDFWNTVQSDADSCLNRSCPWFKKCFYHRARHEANISDVVITNHALLLTDVKADHRILPGYKHLVIDEAHHFEEVASKHLGLDTSYFGFVNKLSLLFKDSRSGYLPMLRTSMQHNGHEKADKWCEDIDSLHPRVVKVKEEWDLLSEQLFQFLSTSDVNQNETGQYVLRLKSGELPHEWKQWLVTEDNIYVELTEILKKTDKLLQDIKEELDEYDLQSLLTDLTGIVKDLYGHRDVLRFFMKMDDENFVYWLEASAAYKSKSLQLIGMPTDVSPMLKQYFFDPKDSIVMTSATLSVHKSFQYTCEQLGLNTMEEKGKLRTSQLPSPFNYRQQALVCIPRDFPSVKGAEDRFFIQRLADSLKEVAIQMNGCMMVLFTSYRMLRLTYDLLKEELAPHGIQVFGQGVDSGNRSKLTRLFIDSKAAVLLGTSSFWEGVDIPGDALSCLAIVRLPFQPPNHPLVEAKCEAVKKQNKNPFMAYSVPQAVIRFKQGFGRLVRTANDYGIVILYDTRVIDTQYGKHFLYSLPGPKIEHMPTKQMVPRIREWLESHAGKDEGNTGA